jgi:hypothetical protein
MKKAIEYLKSLGIRCDKDGNILSKLPDGERGLELVDMLEENTEYTIIHEKLQKQDR